MKILFIGGTGRISSAISKKIAEYNKDELFIINRGNRNNVLPDNIQFITADVNNEEDVKTKINGINFDVVCDFIGFTTKDVERDYRLFSGNIKQYIYISSASAYNKPCTDYKITEGTTLSNPYWEYSQNKIYCEEFLIQKYRKEGFPVTIVRPSHTYDERAVPVGVRGNNGSFQVVKRMLENKPVIIHGDGTSLWTVTHNSDFAKGFIGLIGNAHAIGESFHITSDETVTWNQIYYAIADSLNVEIKPYYVSSSFLASISNYDFAGGLIGDKANSVVFDNTKLKRAVPDFKASVRMKDGIQNSVEYIMSHSDCQIIDEEFDRWCDKVIGSLEEVKLKFK